MKVRKGFVSNSSSSSFIVAFPKDLPMNEEAVKNYLMPGQEAICAYDWIGTFSASDIANQVFKDMSAQTPNVNEQIMEALGGHIAGAPDMDQFRKRRADGLGYDYDWDAYGKASDEFREKMAEKIKAEFAEMNLFTFEYSDNDGNFFCTMEHGGVFDNVPHVRISNH